MAGDPDAGEVGAEREDARVTGRSGEAHPVDGRAALVEPPWVAAPQPAPSAPDVVDFDALNAALGALPSTPSSPQISDSEGRSSATYASARPHPVPVTRAPQELNAPPVIVATEDTVPSGPPPMTVPLTPGGGMPVAPHAGGPHGAAPPPGPPYVALPQHPASDRVALNGHQGTVPMAGAPRPRRPKTPTVVVRTRGPSRTKKLLVFVALLGVVVVGGTALLLLRPSLLGGAHGRSAPSAPAPRAPPRAP